MANVQDTKKALLQDAVQQLELLPSEITDIEGNKHTIVGLDIDKVVLSGKRELISSCPTQDMLLLCRTSAVGGLRGVERRRPKPHFNRYDGGGLPSVH